MISTPKRNDIVLTTYFTTKPDPQTGLFIRKNSPDQMYLWIRSLHNCGLSGLIFHDELRTGVGDVKVLAQYVQFQKYKLKTTWSVNDERFLCWLEYLEAHPEIDRVLLTDLFDVEFFRNPFLIINEPDCIYTGAGMRKIEDNTWLGKKMTGTYKKVFHSEQWTANAGVIGGFREPVMRLIQAMVVDFKNYNPKDNINMQALNVNLYNLFPRERIYVGHPLTSTLKRYEFTGDFCIRHK